MNIIMIRIFNGVYYIILFMSCASDARQSAECMLQFAGMARHKDA